MKRFHLFPLLFTAACLVMDSALAQPDRVAFPQSVASGDPRPDSVVLWTRMPDTNTLAADLSLTVQVATDEAFQQLVVERTNLVARVAHDHCVKVKIGGLQPYTTYYYRFLDGGSRQSPVGRTRTAPAPDAAQPVRFAYLNCQDYVGRYYNTLADLLHREEDTIDFIVYLGDYVYETTGDPLFQTTGAARSVQFGDAAGAITLGDGVTTYQAASSLDNYRDLYRIYRRDPVLQRLHERFPILAIWDDHEFSDDSHGDTATFFDGFADEKDAERKRRAEQAYFEYLPIDIGLDGSGIAITAADLFPHTRLYRDFQFGRYLHLLLTDSRTYRPDHLIAEDAVPGAVAMDEATLTAVLGAAWPVARMSFDPYIDLDEAANASWRSALSTLFTFAYLGEGLDANGAALRATHAAQGKMSATYINALLSASGQALGFDAAALALLPRGLSYLLLGKQDLFSSFGSRYAVPRQTFQIYAAYRDAQEPGSQDLLGPAQWSWLADTLDASSAHWKVVGSSTSFCPITFDFAQPPFPLPVGFPEQLRTQLQLNADHWDGFPHYRQKVVDLLAQHEATLISGDIHGSFVSRHHASNGRGVPEFTGTSVSSENFQEAIAEIVRNNPATANLPGISDLVAATPMLIMDAATRLPESDILAAETTANGYVILEATAASLRAIYRHLPSANVGLDLTSPAYGDLRSALVRSSSYLVSRDGEALAVRVESEPAADFQLQVLHASDLEGGVDAIGDAPNFAAVVGHLRSTVTNTLVLSAGDNYIPGPFFNAASDPVLRSTLDAVNEAYFETSGLDIREGNGRGDVTIMNLIGFDASALGNHEFDAGTPLIREIIGTTFSGTGLGGVRWLGIQFPYLSANLDFSGDGNLRGIATNGILPNTAFRSTPEDLTAAAAAPKIAPATLITRNGEVIGVVGVSTPMLAQISSPGATVVKQPGAGTSNMAQLASILQPVIDELLQRGVNKIILVSHLQQLALEQELISLLRGVDIVIAGGSDTLLANPGQPLRAGDIAAGPYPILTRNADGDPAYVVSTGGQYSYVGRLVAEFDAAGRLLTNGPSMAVSGPFKTDDEGVASLWGTLEAAFPEGAPQALVRELTSGVSGIVTAKDGNILGRTGVFIEGRRAAVRTEESNLGSLSADANLWLARWVDPSVTVSIKNGGGIRAEIGTVDGMTGALLPTEANPAAGKAEGDISQLDLENSLRFNNTLTLLTVTAEGLRQILEHGVAASRPGATPGQFPQVGGLEFIYDPARAAVVFDTNGVVTTTGERIRHLRVTGLQGEVSDTLVEDGVVVGDPQRTFRLVTLNFLANAATTTPGRGGDGYPFPALGRDRLDLAGSAVLTPGLVTFPLPGSEQDAMAEYLVALHQATPYRVVETPASHDVRIANTSNAAPRFLPSRITEEGWVLTLPTVAGRTYRLEQADVSVGPWSAVPGGTYVGDGMVLRVTLPLDVALPPRFFRWVE